MARDLADLSSILAAAVDPVRSRQMLDLLPVAIYLTDAHGHLTHFNAAAAALSGRTPKLGIDRWCVSWRLYHPDGSPMPLDTCPMAAALKDQRAIRGAPAIGERPDGTRFRFEASPTPLFDAAGVLIGGLNVLVERSLSDPALRISEERFRAFTSATSDVVYCMNADWSEMRRLQGREFPSDTLEPTRDWLERYIHPDDQRMVRQAIRAAIESKTTFELEHRVTRVDGTLGWVHSRAVPILDDDGEILEWIAAASDVTRRRANEESLRVREMMMAGQREALEHAIHDAPLDTSLAALVRSAIEGVGGGVRAGFYLANADKTALHHIVGMGAEYAAAVDGFTVGPDSVACGLATHTGRPVLTSDVRKDPLWQPWLWMAEKFDYRACWSFPIHCDKESFIGTLAIYSRRPREATARDLEICSLVTHTASVVISRHKEAAERLRAERALRASEQQLAAELASRTRLYELSVRLAGKEGLEAVTKEVMIAAAELLGADRCTAQLLERQPAGDQLRLIASSGFDDEFTDRYRFVDCHGSSTCAAALSRRETVIAEDLAACPEFSAFASVAAPLGVRAAMSIPLGTNGDTTLGVFTAYWDRAHRPTEPEMRMLDLYVQQAARQFERRAAEHALRESEARFRWLFESMGEGCCVIEMVFDEQMQPVDFRFLETNPAFEKQSGLENANGQLVRDLIPEVEQQWIDRYGHVALTGETLRFENEVAALGRTFEVCAFRLGPPELRRVGVLFNDVSHRKQAESALRRNAETFAALVEQSPLGIYTVDADFRVAHASAGSGPAFRNVQPVIGRDFAEVMHAIWPESFANEAIEIFRRVIATGEPYVSPGLTETRKDIETVESYEWQVNRVMLADGRYGAVCYYFDATRIQQANQALRASEERFRMVADNMAQLAWTCDSLGHVTWYNKRWLEYTGLSFEEMQGWDWSKVQHPDHVDRVVATVKRSAETGELWEDTFPLRGADGRYRWFLSRAVPIRDENGAISCWFGTNTDVTALREAEEALKEGDRRKDEFLATLAHELRNPLAPIRNGLHILRLAGDSPTDVQELLERQVSHLVRLVDDLMEVSRITRGKIDLRKEQVDLAAVVQGAVETSMPLIEAARHRLDLTCPPEPITLDADPVRLTQIFSNLLNNAVKYTDEGGRIWLTVEREESTAVISVRDSGMGIPTEMLDKVFGLFTQVDRTYSRAQGGLGIGLTLVQSLVSMHGGSIEARSEGPGRGSEFVVRLPLVAGPAREPDPIEPSAPHEALPALRVLVVDDNRDAAASLAMVLKVLGADVRTAYDGEAALEVLRTYKPSVALLDLGMPCMDGFEVARRARREPHGRDVTLIALTGWGQEEDRRRSREAGFDHHLVKPVDLEALQELLRLDADRG